MDYFLLINALHPQIVNLSVLWHLTSYLMDTEVVVAIAYSTAGLAVSCVGVYFAYKLHQRSKWKGFKKLFGR